MKVWSVVREERHSRVDIRLSHVRVQCLWRGGDQSLWRVWPGLLLQQELPEEGLEGPQGPVSVLQGDQPGL